MNSGNNYSAKNPEEKFGVRVQDKKGCWTCPAATHKVIGVAYIFSPRGWIALQSVEATKQYKPMKPEDLTDDMLRPVLRIMAPSKSESELYVTIVKTDGDEARCKIKSSDLVDYLNMEIL